MKNLITISSYEGEAEIDMESIWNQETGQAPILKRQPNGAGGYEVTLETADGQTIHFDDEGMLYHLMTVCGMYILSLENSPNLSDNFRASLR